MSSTDNLKTKFKSLAPHLNERLTRLWAAAEAIALGRGATTQPNQQKSLLLISCALN